jgi:surface carbohydrate biosynthesis protein
MNILLRIEVLGRELQGRLLLALAAAERGHHVVLLDKRAAYRLLERAERLPVGYFHDNSPGQDGGKTVLHEGLAAHGWLITGQDEEHGLATDDFLSDMGGRFPPRAMANKAAMFAFGPFDAEGIRRDCPVYADRVFLTGSPRVDFWRRDLPGRTPPGAPDQYLLFLMSSSPFFAEGPRISFTEAGGSRVELMRRIDGLVAEGIDAFLAAAYRRVVDTKLAVEDLARRHPSLAVVYRPHPHELVSAWEQVFADAPSNVRVIRDNAVSPWVRHARCVVFGGSTVGFEAAFAGVPVVCFQPEGFDETPSVSRMGHRATSIAEVTSIVDAIIREEEPALDPERAAAMQETLSSRFFAMEGRLAADRIVDVWEELATEAVRAARPITSRDLRPRRSVRTFARTVRDALVIALRLERPDRRAQRRADRELLELKFPPFDLEEVLSIRQGLVEDLGRFQDIRITRLGARVLHLARD